jgi:predicted ATP-grasp superfamily ATP-dependent carboligase/ubiquinone/menaquinone biosynthesis C-methylase UbiE
MTAGIGASSLPALAVCQPAEIGDIDTSTPVLVLTASPPAHRAPHGGLGILRSLGRLGVPVYTVDSDPRRPASYSRYLRGRFVIDLVTADPDATVEYLLEVGKRIGSRAILIPTWDDMAVLVSDHFEALSERFDFPQQPDGLARSLAGKKDMYLLARRHSIPTPEASFPSSVEEVRSFAATATFPVMLKGIAGYRLQERTGRKMVIVDNAGELVRLYQEMEDPADPNLMLQEYIPGGDDAVWMFNGYFNHESDCLVGFTGRKLRQTPVYTGATSLGICLKNDVVEETTRRWMKELGYRGVLDIGYRYDARDGQYKVLDVNPRIGGTFRLFVARNGTDVARALYLDMTGQPVPVAELVEGRKWMDERDVISCLHYRRDHRLTLRQWASSLKGVRETIYFARDDLAPFWRAWAFALGRTLGAVRSSSRSAGAGRTPARDEERTVQSGAPRQEQVDRLFESTAQDWKTIYGEQTVYGLTYQERRATALDWIDRLGLPDGAPVLEIGCGAGLTAVALAGRGLSVTAIDSAPAMIQLTDQLAHDRDLADRIRTSVADAHNLPFPDGSFSLVLALGVLPWLHSPDRALEEMARVVRPGGSVLASVDNLLRMHYLLDPRLNPALGSLRRSLGRGLRRIEVLHTPTPLPVRLDSTWRFDAVMARLGLDKVRSTTIGFGPFTFWRRPVLSEPKGMRLHRTLQEAADRGVPLVRSTGGQYLVLARKADATGPESGRVIGRP